MIIFINFLTIQIIKDNEHLIVEKKNLVNLFKLVLKELIQSSISNNKTIDKHSSHFLNFFDVYGF
jgi:hypothetical protein